jgi:uncharacterized membrane protein
MSFNFSEVKWGRVVLWSILGLIVFLASAYLYVTVRMFILGFQLGGNPPQEAIAEFSSGTLYKVVLFLAMALGGFLGGRAAARKAEGSYLLNGLLAGIGLTIVFTVYVAVTGGSLNLAMLLFAALAIAGGALGSWVGGRAAEAEAYA